ncbi:Pyruvate decarboxylase 2 [Camellia lanceoleosa]|uniref:Pyruvate decarboxylase 2 n=1 Tax=Camellia lanceoleosa TaxID=1840588 RepID=A0ACC0FAQ0_9ERIC|nr:Pyruvate decarboxylase 2 [Camellia lanceoleosa]
MNKGKRRKAKRILKRGAIFRAAADATSSSISSGSIINRNRIILSEAQAVWEMGKDKTDGWKAVVAAIFDDICWCWFPFWPQIVGVRWGWSRQIRRAEVRGAGAVYNIGCRILRNNNISGSIPSNIGDYQRLLQLFLGNNKLTGTLPAQKSTPLLNMYEFQMQYGSIGWAVGATLGYAQSHLNKQ